MDFNYSQDTYNALSAREVLPVVLREMNVQSVVDVGCGNGSWLSVCRELGIEDIQGIDAEYIRNKEVMIDSAKIQIQDLNEPFDLERKFGLVICLEVAEHLKVSSAKHFVESLTKLSDNILFSAAVPGQGGQFHINEQFQSYWQKQFDNYGYHSYDIRSFFWDNSAVLWWYRQNTFLYSKENLPFELVKNVDLIHPELLLKRNRECEELRQGFGGVRLHGKAFLKSLKRKLIGV